MWPAKWIHEDVDLQSLLARWRGTSVQIWEYSVSHSRLLIRMMREKSTSGHIADAYLLCRGCDYCRFQNGWFDMNVSVKRKIIAGEDVQVVSDGERLNIECISVSAFEPEAAALSFLHLADELRGLPPLKNQVNFGPDIEYIVIRTNGQTAEEISRQVRRVTDISTSQGAGISDILHSLVVVNFNSLQHGSDLQNKRTALAQQLNRELSGQLKIVHGAARGQDGKFDAMLNKLDRLEFGQIEELEN